MFTGIITHTGIIDSSEMQGDLRIKVTCDFPQDSIKVGDSIACSGACLTVTSKGFLASGKIYFTADLSAETLVRTVPGQWDKGRKLNLERSLKMGDSLDGHIVSGHVDGLAKVADIQQSGDSHIMTLEVSPLLGRYVAEKGSVTLDGVSLTVNSVHEVGGKCHFNINVIPHTWAQTTLGERAPGDSLNFEADMIARYVARLMGK